MDEAWFGDEFMDCAKMVRKKKLAHETVLAFSQTGSQSYGVAWSRRTVSAPARDHDQAAGDGPRQDAFSRRGWPEQGHRLLPSNCCCSSCPTGARPALADNPGSGAG